MKEDLSMKPRLQSPARAAFVSRCCVVLTVFGCVATLYGLSRACDPESYFPAASAQAGYVPTEDDFKNVADPTHNLRIFALRDALGDRGFMLEGERELLT